MPVVKTADGKLSVTSEVMAGIWQQIVGEGKRDLLFYDGCVNNLQEWLNYIYDPNNYVALVVDETGHVYHIAWINKFYQGAGFVHHCSLGNYNRRTWPTLKSYWQSLKDDYGQPIIKTVLGVTPVTNEKAVKLLRVIGWTQLGVIPGICYLADDDRHVGGVISFSVINEV